MCVLLCSLNLARGGSGVPRGVGTRIEEKDAQSCLSQGWSGKLLCIKRSCHSSVAFSNSNPVLKQSKSHALAGLSANPISAWKPSLTQSLARRREDPPSVSPSLPVSRWPDGHLGFLAAPETALSMSPSIPHPAVPQRPEPRRPGGGGRPTPPGHPASFGKSDSEDLGAPSHHRTRVLLARRAHLICPWQARRAAPLPLRCAALPPGPARFRAEEAGRLQPLPRRRPAPAL